MSPRYSQSADGARPADGQPAEEERRPFTTGIGSMVGPGDDETAPPPPSPAAPPSPPGARPTFTARPGGAAAGAPEPAHAPDDATEPDDTLSDAPAIGPDDGAAAETKAAPAGDAVPGAGPAVAAGLDEPLLSDAGGLRARWQRVQAGFVDDPREAVGEAADLIEQTAQAMIGALRQRQRQLREMRETGPAGGPASGEDASGEGASAAHGGRDTEQLRQLMRHYRALFNQLCGP